MHEVRSVSAAISTHMLVQYGCTLRDIKRLILKPDNECAAQLCVTSILIKKLRAVDCMGDERAAPFSSDRTNLRCNQKVHATLHADEAGPLFIVKLFFVCSLLHGDLE